MAVDRVVYTLYAHPKLFKISSAEVAAAVAPQVDIPQEELLTLLNRQPSGIRVADTLTEENRRIALRALRIDGLELVPGQQRFYPQQGLFAPIVGFVNLDGEPQAGLEIAHADRLAVQPVPADASAGLSADPESGSLGSTQADPR